MSSDKTPQIHRVSDVRKSTAEVCMGEKRLTKGQRAVLVVCVAVLGIGLSVGMYFAMRTVETPHYTAATGLPPVSAEQIASNQQAAARDRQQEIAVLEAEADKAQALRTKKLRRRQFPVHENVITGCIAQRLSIAYKLQLGSDVLAQRFLKHIAAVSRCTAFGSSAIERALLPALSYLGNTDEISSVIATASDICAAKADSSDECLSSTVAKFAALFER